jgi:6-carboxyhexanoate--CoA ligase
MAETLYSIRMRASRGATHVSGAERIVRGEEIHATASDLLVRALSHVNGRPDSIKVVVDCLAGKDIRLLTALPVTTIPVRDSAEGREKAIKALVEGGVSEKAARTALEHISKGASPSGGNMRGAMVIDAGSGLRLEPDSERGIRARAVDYECSFLPELFAALYTHGLSGTRFKEALALATKVAGAPGAVAELCISDNPGYVTGYVASQKSGYVRISHLKDEGDRSGGRAFFVDPGRFDLDEYLHYMRETPVLVTGPLEIRGQRTGF